MNSGKKEELVAKMLDAYYGMKTVRQVGEELGVSTGKTYYLLRDAGCAFRKTGVPMDGIRHFTKSTKGTKRPAFSAEWRRHMSEARKKHIDGVNVHGHTKARADGYVAVYAPEHPGASKDGYVMQHRLVVEMKEGRLLSKREVVHHINGVRSDNRIENLQIMDAGAHMSLHMKKRYKKASD